MAIVLKKKIVSAPAPAPIVDRPPAKGSQDAMFYTVREKCGVSALIPWVLMASYAYYVLDKPLISDGVFDNACRELLEHWDQAEHRHKHLIDQDSLRSGSLFQLSDEDYPLITKYAARRLLGI